MSKLILFGEGSLKRALAEFVEHFQAERPHQGKGNLLLFPTQRLQQTAGAEIVCRQQLGGLLRYYVVPHDVLDRTGSADILFGPTAPAGVAMARYERA